MFDPTSPILPSDRRLLAPLWLRGAAGDKALTSPDDESSAFCGLAREATRLAETVVLPTLTGRTGGKCVVQETFVNVQVG